MGLLLLSFFAGVLTVFAPCVFPLLPVIIGGSVADKNPLRPLIITLSLAGSVVLFTLLLKVSSALIGIDQSFWKAFSGGLVILFGITYIFPKLWTAIEHKFKLGQSSQQGLAKANQKKGVMGAVLVGLSLGPVFASCSPTYGLILSTVLPSSFIVGLINLLAYAVGLALVMFIIAFFGRKFIHKMTWATDVNGWFRKVLGVLFLLVGLSIITGFDKEIEARILDNEDSYIYKLLDFENKLIEKAGVKE